MTLQQFNVTGPQSLQGLVSCCADPWPLGAAVPSRQLVVLWDGGSGGETWPLGIHLGSGGKEWVIGLRATFSVLIGQKGVRRWEEREIDRGREREREEKKCIPFSTRWLCRLSTHSHRLKTAMWLLTRGIQRVPVGIFSLFSVSRIMGEDGQGVRLAMPATWAVLVLFTVTSVHAVEGRFANQGASFWVLQLAQGDLIYAQWLSRRLLKM